MWQGWRLMLSMDRKLIDVLDFSTLYLVGWRMRVCGHVGKLKVEHHLPIYAPEREREVLMKRISQARKAGIGEAFVIRFTRSVMGESKRLQQEQIKELVDVA